MSSAAFASTSRLSHTARIGSSRHTDAPLRSFRSSGVAARHGRRATRVVAAVAEPGTVAAPLTKEDLVDYLRSGCKPKEQWRCVRGAVDPRPTTWPRAFPPPPKPLARRVSSREFPETRPSRPFLEQIKPSAPFLVAEGHDASSAGRAVPPRSRFSSRFLTGAREGNTRSPNAHLTQHTFLYESLNGR
jgi:hypothetical protein